MLINIHTHRINNDGIEIYNLPNTLSITGFYSYGIHPWNAESILWNVDKIIPLISQPSCLAVGEIGLDKLKGPDMKIQTEVFLKQIEISEKVKKPVLLHCVRSWNEIKAIKKEIKPMQPWIFHGFSKSNILEDVLMEGVYVSLGAEILSNSRLQEAIQKLPTDKMFLETDDSEISIETIYKKVSELKNLTLSDLELIIEENFNKVFTR